MAKFPVKIGEIGKIIKLALDVAAADEKVPLKPADVSKIAPRVTEAVKDALDMIEPAPGTAPGSIDLGRYSKFIGGAVGSLVGGALSWLAVQFPQIATCRVVEAVDQCSMFGFSQAQVTAALIVIGSQLGVYWFPPNNPPA